MTYRPGGARQALREVARAAETCPRGPTVSSVAGVGVVTYRVRRVHVAHLTPGSVALVIHTSAVVKARRKNESYVAIYQTRGDVLPGVYIYGGAVSGQLRRASRAARRSAGNLA